MNRGSIALAGLVAGAFLSQGSAAGDVCNGLAGIPCGAGEFCELPDGACCCDFFGTCATVPEACPAVWDPVCGCDGATYGSRCEASAASVSVDHVGPCGSCPPVGGVSFAAAGEMSWDAAPGAIVYNVYRNAVPGSSPASGGHCLSSALREARFDLEPAPPAGTLWLLQVTAADLNGEGSMGSASDGTPRVPATRCTCTLPADSGPCDGVFPRWYYDYVEGRCSPFQWGGCEGNANNFETLEQCLAACGP
jgi:hypothetical protein